MLELTPKEIQNVGYDRYLREKGRYWKATIYTGVALVVVFVFDKFVPKPLRSYVDVGLLLCSAIPFLKLIIYDATKAGKRFREEWEKERLMVEGYKYMANRDKEQVK